MREADVTPPWAPTTLRFGDPLVFLPAGGCTFVSVLDDRAGGIYRSDDGGRTWASCGDGLPGGGCVPALHCHAGTLLAGTLGQGVFRRDPSGWRPAGRGLPEGTTVLALASGRAGVVAGTQSDGVFTSSDGGATWRPLNDGLPLDGRALAVSALGRCGGALLALHAFGLHHLPSGARCWEAMRLCLPGAAALVGLAGAGRRGLLGWSTGGVYRSDDRGGTWRSLAPAFWQGRYARSLVQAAGVLFAGTAGDPGAPVVRSVDGGITWEPFVEGLPYPSWSVTLAVAAPYLFAGVAGHGVWRRPLPSGARRARRPPFVLHQNEPDPFEASTVIHFQLHRPSRVSLALHDAAGRCLATLLDGEAGAGEHTVTLDGSALGPGFYTYTLAAGGLSQSRRLLVLR